GLWRAYEEIIRALVQRKSFAEARRLLDEVVGDPECPPARQRVFRMLWGSVLGGEVRGATARAVRHIQSGREDDAVTALSRAGSVMAQIAVDAVSPKRRQELERRLWWGYMKLGVARLEAGAREDAVGPLFEAL